jgi:phosphate transport system substrate-binding protein
LEPAELQKAGLAQWPMVMGGIVLVVNLDGVKPGDINLDGPTTAKIYLGEIAKWNDPALKAEGKDKVGEATSVEWPGGIGAKGNDGVANNVATTKGAIGYVEFAYADQNKLTFVDMLNKAGKTVAPTMESFQAAAANADWANAPGYYLVLSDQPGDKSWPMTAATFILMPKNPPDAAAAKSALDFFKWAYEKGDKMAQDLDYIPMPDNVVAMVEKTWASDIKLK